MLAFAINLRNWIADKLWLTSEKLPTQHALKIVFQTFASGKGR
jgi:hypothetical protein